VTHGLPVLIVEDDEDAREAVADLLSDEGFVVAMAGSAEEALDRLRGGTINPCLLLIDLLMPQATGWELLLELRREPRLAAIPTIVMTGLAEPGLPPGIPVVRKPIDRDELLAAIRGYQAAGLEAAAAHPQN
jgi:CheY-like chemotaxis protein